MFVELIELFVFTSLSGIPTGEEFEFPPGELAKGLFLWSGGITRTDGLEAQSDSLIRHRSCGIAKLNIGDCPDGGDVKFRRVGIRI